MLRVPGGFRSPGQVQSYCTGEIRGSTCKGCMCLPDPGLSGEDQGLGLGQECSSHQCFL